jgi:hypothetical protein
MALFSIPNPKKNITIDFSIDKVKRATANIPAANKTYFMFSTLDSFNQYTLQCFEFVSAGVFIDINLNSVSENKTEVVIEVRRKIGSFDQSYEVTKANKHIDNIITCMSKVINMTDEEIKNMATKKPSSEESKEWYNKEWLVVLLMVLFLPIGIYALIRNKTISFGWKLLLLIIVVAALYIFSGMNR